MSNESRKIELGNLPDCVISHILSCLPTKDAVRTSILSKDWEYKWTRMHKFALDDGNLFLSLTGLNNTRPNFVKFVERTLLLSPNLHSFRLCCKGGEYALHRWIAAALSRNVSCLEIKCIGVPRFVLPRNVLTCYSLRTLRLEVTGCTFRVPEKVSFPNLTTLDLSCICISKEQSDSDRVEFHCPLLEKLELSLCEWLNMRFVEIYAPKLTRLELSSVFYASDGCSVKINGNSLEKLTWYASSGSELNDIALHELGGVVYANLEFYFGRDSDLGKIVGRDDVLLGKSGLELRKLLKGFSSLRDLKLFGDVGEVIAKSKLGISLPTYYKMERLILNPLIYIGALFELLRAMPSYIWKIRRSMIMKLRNPFRTVSYLTWRRS